MLVPGAQTVHVRETWQSPAYPVFGPMDVPGNNDTCVIHYTAADDLIDGDPGEHADDLPAYMRAMQRSYVLNRGYSLGYSFAVDWLGGIWQVRGWEFQSAANAGHNAHTIPFLVLVDGADPATPEAAASIRLLVAEAERRSGNPQKIVGHGQLSGAATACPGVGLRAQITAGVFTPTTPEVITPPGDLPMRYYAKPPAELPGNPPHLVVWDGDVRYRCNFDTDPLPEHTLNVEQYPFMLKCAGLD